MSLRFSVIIALSLLLVAPVFPIQAQTTAITAQVGFVKNAQGQLRYLSTTTHRTYVLMQPKAAFTTLRPLAKTMTTAQWSIYKNATTSRASTDLVMVEGVPTKIWYISPTTGGWNYFDGMTASWNLLRREARIERVTLQPRKPSMNASTTVAVTPPSIASSPFSYAKQGSDYVVLMDASKGVKMDILTGHDSIRPTEECRYPKYCKAEAKAEPFSSFLGRLQGASVVLNGGYFDAYSQPLNEQNYHTVSSDLVIHGKMESMYGWDKAWGDGGMIVQKKDGTFGFYYPIRDWVKDANFIETAVSNYPLVLLGGVPRTKEQMPVSDPNDYKFWLSARRGGLGLSADGTKLVYVSTVGTVEDLGKALLKAGAANGFALDAGGSNGFSFQGKTIFSPGRKLASVITFSPSVK